MSRRPAITALLKGQAVKTLFGSISVTCSLASSRFKARAQAAPPKPPPMTTMRAEAWARAVDGRANDAASASPPRMASLRLIRRNPSICMVRKIGRWLAKSHRLVQLKQS